MSLHLIIADDEELTVQSLREFIPWEKFGISMISTVTNGRKALELAQKSPPDILLSDICMPKMDGIELASKIKELNPRCKLIFISGYSDKEYLKSAIALKAEKYIEKPINLHEVEEVFYQVTSIIEEENNKKENEQVLLSSLHTSKPIINRYIALDLTSDHLSLPELYRKYGKLYFPWGAEEVCRAVCIVTPRLQQRTGKKLLSHLESYLDSETCPVKADFFAGLCPDGAIALLLHEPDKNLFFDKLLPELLAEMGSAVEDPVAIGVDTNTCVPERLPSSFQKAYEAAQMSFYGGYGQLFFYDPKRSILSEDESEQLYLSVIGGDDLTVQACRLCSYIKDKEFSNVRFVQKLLYRAYTHVIKHAMPGEVSIGQEAFYALTLQKIHQLLDDGIMNLQLLETSSKCNPSVKKAAQYVLDNFWNAGLSAKLISESIGFSQNYLCTLFRQNTGQTLNDFIVKVRIEKTKGLLRNTSLRLYEIGEKVGVPDPNYLSFMFKKNSGMTPSAFRTRWQEDNVS